MASFRTLKRRVTTWDRAAALEEAEKMREIERQEGSGLEGDIDIPHRSHGDDYYNGDVYDAMPPNCHRFESEWERTVDLNSMPYLKHIRSLSPGWPHLRFLAQWMMVTTSPVKWQFIEKSPHRERIQQKRASRIKVAAIDFTSKQRPSCEHIRQKDTLARYLEDGPPPGSSRLYVVEDLSRDMIELLGAKLDIDPLFFREQINDYLWYNTRDPWVELPDLEVVARDRPYFRLTYVQTRYFRDRYEFKRAQTQAGMFNVLRRLDDDSDHSSLFDKDGTVVALVRSKASLWIRPSRPGEDTVGVLLIDPSITAGYPLWGGYRPFERSPTPEESRQQKMFAVPPRTARPRSTLFDDFLFWTQNMAQQDVDHVRANPRVMAQRLFQIVCAEWLTLSRYAAARLRQIEWEVERPDFRLNAYQGSIDSSLSKSHTWRRRLPLYRDMIADAHKKLFGDALPRPETGDGIEPAGGGRMVLQQQQQQQQQSEDEDEDEDAAAEGHHRKPETMPAPAPADDGVADLRADYAVAARQLDALLRQTERITAVTTAVAAFEESRRAVDQNRFLGRLTYLAVIFAPLSFLSSFLSMTSDVEALTQTIWVFFAAAAPVSLAVYLVVDPAVAAALRRALRALLGRRRPGAGAGGQRQRRRRDPDWEKARAAPSWPYANAGRK
ncbi:hypothetical protein F4780DRAFT_797160 [Xylariomycetidae sp. FL0641]|nr:hypothetical protein F4780DRAFT_797160 [Xylariomycetidae sp. FL0641]